MSDSESMEAYSPSLAKRPSAKAKKDAKKELRKVEKQKVAEERQKAKAEEAKQKEEAKLKREREKAEEIKQKKERESDFVKKDRIKKKVDKKVKKKLATPFHEVSDVLVDYEVEATIFKQTETFIEDFYAKVSKNNQKITAILDERRNFIKDLRENSQCLKEHHPDFHEAIQKLMDTMTFQSDFMFSYYTSFPTLQDSREPSNETKTLKREYYKLLDRYEDIEGKIRSATKEKAVSAAAMEKMTEAEQTRELIKRRLQQYGEVMSLQQNVNASAFLSTSTQCVCDTMKLLQNIYSDGLVKTSQETQWINQSELKVLETKDKLAGEQSNLEEKIQELGSDKWFEQIIKKKPSHKDQDVSLTKSPVLHVATSEGALEMVKILLDKNPEYLDLQDRQGWSPLHVACHKGHTEIAKEIISRGADIYSLTDAGDTALHLACAKPTNTTDCVELLLSFLDHDYDISNKEGYTPIQLAVKAESPQIFLLLREKGCDTETPGIEGSAEEMIVRSSELVSKFAPALERSRAKKPVFRAVRADSMSLRKNSMAEQSTPGSISEGGGIKAFSNLNEDFLDFEDTQSISRSIEEWNEHDKEKEKESEKLTVSRESSTGSITRKIPSSPLPVPPPVSSMRPKAPLPPPPIHKDQGEENTLSLTPAVVAHGPLQLPLARTTSSLPIPKKKRKRSQSMNQYNINHMVLDTEEMEDSTTATAAVVKPVKKQADIQYCKDKFSFDAQKRNTKTYQYHKLRIEIFKDKISIYKKQKLHKEVCTKNIIQCSRSIKYPRKIKLLWRFEKKAEKYLLSSVEQRERFYEAIFLSQHGINPTGGIEHLSIFVGTWNMGNAPPPTEDDGFDAWLQKSMSYDMYVIGLQESEYSGTKELDNSSTVEGHLLRRLSSYLGEQYIKLVGLSMWEIRMFIFVKRDYYSAITNLKTGNLACGVAGVMANKGAVGVSFRFQESTLGFICCHLAAHQNKVEDRNEHFRSIVRGLSPPLRQINNANIDITNQVDHLFWTGDLNYRIDLPREDVMEYIKQRDWNVLLRKDQLRREIESENAFMGFQEEIIVFPPTYKYATGSSNEYSEEKPVRIPAWCDRVLWKTFPREDLQHESYGCCDEITTSDHHPVFATFKLKTRIPSFPSTQISEFKIIIQNLAIKDLRFAMNDGVPSPYITFVGPFLQKAQKTPAQEKTRQPEWKDVKLELIPIFTNRDLLLSKSLRVVVGDKSSKATPEKNKGQRSSQTVIALADISRQVTPFEQTLTSWGYPDCGTLTGEMFIEFSEKTSEVLVDE